MSLQGRNALVTGGSRGIGRAICLELARQGANVAVNYAGNAQAAEETAAACRELGVQAVTIRADVADAAACEAMVKEVISSFGSLHILVNNAGITRDNLALSISEADFDAVLDTNLKGAFCCCKAAYRPMMRQRYGRIINMSSVVGLRGNAGQANYSASKAGLIGLTKSLAKELGPSGIQVNCVAPGVVDTKMNAGLTPEELQALRDETPLGVIGTSEDIAQAIWFLASPESDFITGQVLSPNGGFLI